MQPLERMELVLRRVFSDLDQTPRFSGSDGLILLRCIIDELTKVNNDANKADNRQNAALG
jgi:hypothetical protein